MLVKSQVKYIQSLGQKKFRDDDGVFIAEGVKIINELLVASNISLVNLFATENWLKTNDGLIKKIPANQIIEVKESELERISFLQTPNEVFGIFNKPVFANSSLENTITLLLDEIQDPGNLGTIIRTADWFDIKKIICSKNSADVFNPKVVQATMGSITRVEILYEDLETVIQNNPDIPLYAATLHGQNIFEEKKINKGFILIGNESKGIKSELLNSSAHQITIPKLGKAESLNAAVGAGIVMATLCAKNWDPKSEVRS